MITYLEIKINGYYENARIDYGVNGRFISATESNDNLQIIHEEDGTTLETFIPFASAYTAEQLYYIWMESDWMIV